MEMDTTQKFLTQDSTITGPMQLTATKRDALNGAPQFHQTILLAFICLVVVAFAAGFAAGLAAVLVAFFAGFAAGFNGFLGRISLLHPS